MDVQVQVHSPARLHVSPIMPGTPPKAHCSIETHHSPHQLSAEHHDPSSSAHVPQERTPNGREHAGQSYKKTDDKLIKKNSVVCQRKCIKRPSSPMKVEDICEEALKSGHYLVVPEKKKRPKECPQCYEKIDALELVRVNMKSFVVSVQCPECGLYIYQLSSSSHYVEEEKKQDETHSTIPKGFKVIPVKLGKRN